MPSMAATGRLALKPDGDIAVLQGFTVPQSMAESQM